MPTPHNNAKKGDIAKTVLMPGDPLRAKFIAETYLENPVCYNEVRGMLGFTGTYKGVPVSVQGSGMGMPSMGIYSHELYNEYDVENIIRIGTAGSIADKINLREVIIGVSASTNSNYAAQYRHPGNGFRHRLCYPIFLPLQGLFSPPYGGENKPCNGKNIG